MRLSSILIVAFAFALPISAQAESKSGGGNGGSNSSGSTAKTAAPKPSKSISPCSGPADGTCRSGTAKVTTAPSQKPAYLKLDGVKGESADDTHSIPIETGK